jgi:hypothetical protein
LKGAFLTGQQAVLPEVARGKVTLLALGFTYDSRFAVEAWSNRFRREFGRNPQVGLYEIPMIGGLARLGKWFIDRGMRSGTTRELHENVITVYGGVDPWKEFVGYKRANDAYLILLDAGGVVRWIYQGAFNEAAFAGLHAEVTKHLR